MRVRLPSCILIFAAAMLLFAGTLPGQTISGIIAGRVTDANGKPQAAVAIVVSSEESGLKFTGNTDSQGFYRILEVPPGLYEARAISSMPTAIHSNVRVDVNRTTAENFVLQPEEQRPVGSSAPETDLYSPTLSTAFLGAPVVEIPVVTRDVNNLALLAPGVESVRTFSFASTLVPFSVNGSRGRDNNFTIDSVDNNEPLFGGAATQFTNNEIFQEYSISTGQLKAEFGRNSGATVNAITKSGSNNWHGTLFGFGQDDLTNAMNNVQKQALLNSPETFYDTTLGGTLGGPVKKGKSFFFLSYQWDRITDNLSDVYPVLANYPATPADLATLKGLPTTPALQAYLGTPSVNVVPGVGGVTPCFTGTSAEIKNNQQGLYQAPNPCLVTSTAVNAGSLFGTVVPVNFNVFNVPNANTFNLRDHEVSGRFDQKLNDSNDIYARYLFDDLASPQSPLETPGVSAFSDIGLLPDWKTLLRQRTQSFLLDHRYRRPGGSLNEFRISYSRVSQRQGAFNAPADSLHLPAAIISDCFAGNGTAPFFGIANSGCASTGVGANVAGANTLGGLGGQGTYPSSLGQTQVPAGIFPSVGNLITVGTDSGPARVTSNTYQIQDNYSYTVGRHNIKLGANFAKIDTNSLGMPDDNGFYLFTGFGFLNGFQTFATEPSAVPNCSFSMAPFCPFTDAALTSQRLVNVRTNASGAITGQGPNEIKIKEFDQFYFAQDDWRARSNLTFNFGVRYENFGQPINSVHDINPNAPFVNTDNKDFAPRIGFAYSPWGRQDWVIRGGYGIEYDPPILNLPLLIWQSGPVSPLITTDAFFIAPTQPTGVYPNPPYAVNGNPLAAVQGTNPFSGLPAGFVGGCSQYYDLFDRINGTTVFPGRADTGKVPIVNCSDQNTVSKNLKNPYVQQWSLGVQHELPGKFLAEVDYVGSKGTRLFQRIETNPFQGWDSTCVANIATLYESVGIGNLQQPGQCRFPRIDNTHGDVTQVTNGGSSVYHALQASLVKRQMHTRYVGDLTFTASYTWSHLIDNTSEIFGPGFRTFGKSDLQQGGTGAVPVGFLFDPLATAPVEAITPLAQSFNSTTGAERGNSSFDRRHRFAASFVWQPFTTKNVWAGGWELGGVFTYQSGQPFSPLNASPSSTCADTNGDGSLSNDRPNIGNASLPKNLVALVADPQCLSAAAYNIFNTKTGTTVASGVTQAQAMTMAHFVQRPLFANAAPPGAAGLSGPTTYAGDIGRNSLVGPAITDLDLALYKTFTFAEHYHLQFRWEVYDVFNHPNLGGFNGNPYIGNASAAPAFGFASTRTGAAITGGIPENAIDAQNNVTGAHTFLSTTSMNTGSRRMQFGLRFIF